MRTLPFKLNQDRRHHIPKQKHRVTNSAAYDASLRQRGSLTVWFTDEAVAAWKAEPRATRGGQRWYSPLAIATALTLRAVFRLALRQTEGLIGSIIHLLGLDLTIPDHSTLSRGAESLELPRPRPGGSVRARASKYRLNWDEANRGHAACKIASTVAVLRRWSNLRQSAGTCWWWRERERRKLRSSS